MFSSFKRNVIRSALWFRARADGPHAKAWLCALSFSEATFFIVPVDALLIPIVLFARSRWLYYGLLTTAASVVGGVVGYGIGYFFFDTVGVRIIEIYGLARDMAIVQGFYNENAFFAVFIGAFTPIPYKIFVLSGGFFKIDFFSFLAASVVGRGLRYLLVAGITARFGPTMARLFLRYFNIVTIAAVILAALALLFYSV